jgi:DNA topoisomerase VI subunit B
MEGVLVGKINNNKLKRETFITDRTLEFFSEKELQMQMGCSRNSWPVAIVKELIDNSLDACETVGILPEIEVLLDSKGVSVKDNGPGLPVKTLEQSLNYMVRVSDKNYYISPSRGQLGNALKCLWAMPYVIDGGNGRVDVSTKSKTHRIDVVLNLIAQKPELKHTVSDGSFVKNGTFIRIHMDQLASLGSDENETCYKSRITQLVSQYAAFNPHASFVFGGQRYDRSLTECKKWCPSHKIPCHWYSVEHFRDLIAAHIHSESNGGNPKTVREFVSEFHGFTSPTKQKKVLGTLGLKRIYLHDLVEGGDVAIDTVAKLLDVMKKNSKPPKPRSLGAIGQDHLKKWMVNNGVGSESVKYKMLCGESKGLPYVLEMAFGVFTDTDRYQETVTGLNWAPTLRNPFEILESDMNSVLIDDYDPVMMIVHLVYPQLKFTDKSKSQVML